MPGYSACSRSNNSRDVRQGSASNHPRSSVVTVANGSGRRRKRLGFALGALVGRTSPSCHAVRSPERNCSSVGGVGFATSPAAGVSAISTSCCWAARTSRSRRTGSRVARSSFSRSEEHTSELQSRSDLVCRLLLEKKKKNKNRSPTSKNKKQKK